jgi:hypothetical protein
VLGDTNPAEGMQMRGDFDVQRSTFFENGENAEQIQGEETSSESCGEEHRPIDDGSERREDEEIVDEYQE